MFLKGNYYFTREINYFLREINYFPKEINCFPRKINYFLRKINYFLREINYFPKEINCFSRKINYFSSIFQASFNDVSKRARAHYVRANARASPAHGCACAFLENAHAHPCADGNPTKSPPFLQSTLLEN